MIYSFLNMICGNIKLIISKYLNPETLFRDFFCVKILGFNPKVVYFAYLCKLRKK
jgi:hypothetical protein